MPANPPFFNLTDQADNFTITPGLLDTLPGGLQALGGNDTITGSDQADIVYGNQGDDRLILRKGDDTIYGGKGNDTIAGEQGKDLIFGDLGDDVLYGGAINNQLLDLADTIFGGEGNDIIFGQEGDDSIFGGKGNDTIAGEQGQDFISGDLGNDIIYGSSINNQLPDLADTIFGGEGNDTIFGKEGNDFINGNQDNDYLVGGVGDDIIRGGKGGDVLLGNQGSDTLFGDLGQDALNGGIADVGVLDVDVFVLRGDGGANKLSQSDLILDFALGDKIGITNFKGNIGSLALQEIVPISVSDFINQLSPELQAAQKSGLIDLNNFAFNGLIQGTAISLSTNGPFIGLVLNQSSVQVSSALINVTEP